ncbi:MAG: hypothetical protein RBS38_15240 [Bacteroidales bacterium]|nr:hypothetical protein [Bacteroidales bacterium]
MIVTTAMLMDNLKEYKAPANKIARMVENKEIVPIVRGLYETDPDTAGHLLAASIYAPSYLSFDYALSYHNLIPEAVYNYTSATYDKKKKKMYTNHFGTYLFRDIPKKAYPIGISLVHEGSYSFLIATAEKALCDKIYTLSPVSSQKSIVELLFENLRIDEAEFDILDHEKMIQYAKLYQTTNHKLLIKLLRRKYVRSV